MALLAAIAVSSYVLVLTFTTSPRLYVFDPADLYMNDRITYDPNTNKFYATASDVELFAVPDFVDVHAGYNRTIPVTIDATQMNNTNLVNIGVAGLAATFTDQYQEEFPMRLTLRVIDQVVDGYYPLTDPKNTRPDGATHIITAYIETVTGGVVVFDTVFIDNPTGEDVAYSIAYLFNISDPNSVVVSGDRPVYLLATALSGSTLTTALTQHCVYISEWYRAGFITAVDNLTTIRIVHVDLPTVKGIDLYGVYDAVEHYCTVDNPQPTPNPTANASLSIYTISLVYPGFKITVNPGETVVTSIDLTPVLPNQIVGTQHGLEPGVSLGLLVQNVDQTQPKINGTMVIVLG